MRWKALYFIVSIASLKLTWVLKLMIYVTGSPLPSYLSFLDNVKWSKTGALLIPYENSKLSTSSSRLQDLLWLVGILFFLTSAPKVDETILPDF